MHLLHRHHSPFVSDSFPQLDQSLKVTHCASSSISLLPLLLLLHLLFILPTDFFFFWPFFILLHLSHRKCFCLIPAYLSPKLNPADSCVFFLLDHSSITLLLFLSTLQSSIQLFPLAIHPSLSLPHR